jgi:NAD-dependent histone deacetylase SIR2
MVSFINKHVVERRVPVRALLAVFGLLVVRFAICSFMLLYLTSMLKKPPEFDDDLDLLRVLKVAISRVLRRRAKLNHLNTLQDALRLLREAKRVVVLTGAGVSTSCGIPDVCANLFVRI